MPNPARRVYLDVCSLCRPFDDQDQMRIRLETDAVHLILSYVRAKKLELVISPVHEVEIAAIGDLAERTYLQLMVRRIGSDLALDLTQARQRAEELVHRQFGPADAAHLAFAEQAGADLVTCDDRLLRLCRRVKPGVWCGTPIAFCDKENLR
jgi:predicted nucleic acid-binding protein